jgi:hypothetical protein
MSSQRYAREFKDKEIRQIVERGYSVGEVSETSVEDLRILRLIGSSHAASGGLYGEGRVFQDLGVKRNGNF